jgi:hypothetical protein
MVDRPWKGRTLTKGQIEQKLESMSCVKLNERLPDSQLWRAPNGKVFWISITDCNKSEYLEKMIETIERWVREAKK